MSEATNEASAQPTSGSEVEPVTTVKHAGYPRVREAIAMVKEHPLGAMATVAAATAFIEVELAVGILAGLGATALLATKSGPEAREQVFARGKLASEQAFARGKLAIERARTAFQGRMKPKEAATDTSAAPPA